VPAARGLVLRADVTEPSNFRASQHLDRWLTTGNLIGITGVDTRRLTRLIRKDGFQTAAIVHGEIDIQAANEAIAAFPGLEGMDLAKDVTCRQTYTWDETLWRLGEGYGRQGAPKYHVVAVDYGIKRNILRHLAERGCRVTVVPASATTDDIMRHEPDGIFLSNGPGDPAATGQYAVPVIRDLIATGKPVFGICLGHQMLALALGAKTAKMYNGHRGANHPIKNLETGAVEITSQNHGFVVDMESLPAGVACTHVSLFDGTLAGLKMTDKPVFSVQYHPEASPGPQDSRYLFDNFLASMEAHR
jgi:carbamoyl-phosphate synthase small subunit